MTVRSCQEDGCAALIDDAVEVCIGKREWRCRAHVLAVLMIPGDSIVAKNSRRIFRGKGGQPFIAKRPAYREWQERAVAHLRAQWGSRDPIAVPVGAAIHTHLRTRRRVDASNLYQGIEDSLVAAGVLVDDVLIEHHDGSRRHHDKSNPRIEIVLTRSDGGWASGLDVGKLGAVEVDSSSASSPRRGGIARFLPGTTTDRIKP